MRRFSKAIAVAVAGAVAATSGVVAQLTQPAMGQGAQVAAPPLTYTTRTLGNGLKVYALQDRTTGNVAVQTWFDVGSKHDPEGRSGFAHLLEHMLSRTTRNMPLNMVNQLTEDAGGTHRASTDDDRTNFYDNVHAVSLETMLWTHAERMARPVLDSETFETERNLVKQELSRIQPYTRLGFIIPENCYDVLPERRAGMGNMADLDAATPEEARGFQEAFYGPDTATLIVSGNFDPAQLDRLIDKYFGAIPKRQYPASLAMDRLEKTRTGSRAFTAYAPNVPASAVGSIWRLPPLTHRDAPALAVLNAILAQSGLSRQIGLAYNFDVPWWDHNFEQQEDGGCLAPIAEVPSGVTVEAAEAKFRSQIARLRDQLVAWAELVEAKNQLLALDLRQRETFEGRASLLGEALTSTGDPTFADKNLAAMLAVTREDVQRVARTYLSDANRVDMRYLDESKRPKGEADNWRNPVPMPKLKPPQTAKGTPNQLLPEGQREAPPGPIAPQLVMSPQIVQQTLSNGLKVIAAKTSDVPFATMALAFSGGASTDPADKAGLAGLTVDLAIKGTAWKTEAQVLATFRLQGAQHNYWSDQDSVGLGVTAPATTFEGAGRMLSDLALNPIFPQAQFEQQRQSWVNASSTAMKNPGRVAGFVRTRAVYAGAPYGLVSTEASLKRLTRDDLVAAQKKWWRPDNATLIITGGVDTAQAFALAQTIFGGWKVDGLRPTPPAAPAGDPHAQRVIVIDMPGAQRAFVSASLRAVKRSDVSYPPLVVANAVLGDSSNGRLIQELRVKRGLSDIAFGELTSRLDVGLMIANAAPKNESVVDVAKVIMAEIERLKTEPFVANDIDKPKIALKGHFNRNVQSAAGLGFVIAELTQQGMQAQEAVYYPTMIGSVTPEWVNLVAPRIAGADKATLVIVGDGAKFLVALKAAYPQTEVIPIGQLDLDGPTLRKK